MANIYKGMLGLIGNTPLVEVVNIEKELGLEATVLVKLEYMNPAGSVKDRVAKALISLGREELTSMAEELPVIEVDCHFCDKVYKFTPEEVKKLI